MHDHAIITIFVVLTSLPSISTCWVRTLLRWETIATFNTDLEFWRDPNPKPGRKAGCIETVAFLGPIHECQVNTPGKANTISSDNFQPQPLVIKTTVLGYNSIICDKVVSIIL
jgi:hypothetical protein